MNERFEYWQSRVDKLWYFHLAAPTGEIIAQGEEGYTTRSNCLKGIHAVKRFAHTAKIVQR